ncbi:PQQ-binding-like beta-propeller repeat protein, partial [bacterium]|nr:PQQ-binding-like beta-propeller repeat protein [bacterium]
CGKGRLTAALRAGERFTVHGLAATAADAAATRAYLQQRGLYGPVSVEHFDATALPYVDNLVNLVAIEPGGRVPMAEVMRVLAPRGVAMIGGRKTVKPWPRDIDEWTHFLHDASNNAVAKDERVGPPRRLRWLCGPLWTRSHEHTSSLVAMVSAGGRLFYVFDEGLTGVTRDPLPERWTLIARDAFNGILLWKRPVAKWRSGRWRNKALRNIPGAIPRRLVAQGERLFITLEHGAPVTAIDAATGEDVTVYKGTEGAEELRALDGVLLVRKAPGGVVAIDTKTGATLWQASGRVQGQTLAAHGDRVFCQAGQVVRCVGLRDGRQQWQIPMKTPLSLILVRGERVVLWGTKLLEAVSAQTGESLWKGGGVGRGELFIAGKHLWHWEGGRVVGRDLTTGKVTARPNTDDVFTPGHHLRCYQSKATDRFLITPYRGVEFVSLTGAEHTQNDWVRGACRYGILPCNGLLYAPPNPCFCYPGVKITGFNALAAAGKSRRQGGERLERGPAYGPIGNRKSPIANPTDWPTYRHDSRRTGATACEVAAQVAATWQVELRGRLTPPVAAGGRVVVAAKEEHTVHALSVDDGRKLWSFTAGGPIDSPPTLDGERVLFGCADGRVYCLRAADGKLAWRYRAAPSDERIVAFGRLESPWRVHGSVLVHQGVVYCTAGRSTYLDGGIWVCGLDPATGRLLHERRLDTAMRTRKDAQGKPFIPAYSMEGCLSDVLVSEGGFLYLGQYKFDAKLVPQAVPYILPGPDEKAVAMDLRGKPFVSDDVAGSQKFEDHQRRYVENAMKSVVTRYRKEYGDFSYGHRHMGRHVFSTAGFLDDTWFNRTFWMYAEAWPGYYLAHRAAKAGQILVVGPQKTYAVQAYPLRNLQSPLFAPGTKGYLLFADANDNEPVLDHRTQGTTKGWGWTRSKPPVWHDWVPVRMRAMVLAGRTLFVAGPPDALDPNDPMGAFEGRKGAVLWAFSADKGQKLAEQSLPGEPVFDGLIAARGRLFLSTRDGRVVCLGAK